MLDEKDLQAIQAMIQESESRILAYIEVAVTPKFDLLADAFKLHQETLAPVKRVEELEDEVAFVKKVAEANTRDIITLKKAQ